MSRFLVQNNCEVTQLEVSRNSQLLPESNFLRSASANIVYNEFEYYTFKITVTYPRG